ncbi:MAG: cytochrome D1 domain-containing protein [Thermoanaerobaculia bacterium]
MRPSTSSSLLFAAFVVAMALVPSGSGAQTLLVANKTDNTVDLIDVASGESVATLPTGMAPHEIAVSSDGSLAVISNYGNRDEPGSSLTIVDVPGARVLRTVDLGEHSRPHGVAWIGENRVAVTTEGSAHLLVVDIEAGRVVDQISTQQEISHMVATTPEGGRAFVANIGSGTVTAIDLEVGAKLADVETGEGAEGIAVTPDGSEVWITNRAADTITIIDSQSLEILDTVACSGFPIRVAITPDGSKALVSVARAGEVVLFDVEQRSELTRRKLDLSTVPDASTRLFGDSFGESPVPVGLVIHPTGDLAWVAATQADAVVVIDTEDLEVQDLLRAGKEPDGMSYSPISVASERRPGAQ